MLPAWSTGIASRVVTFSPAPVRRPASTFSQTRTANVSPGLMVSGERTPAPTKSEPKPRASPEREAVAIDGVTRMMCMLGSVPARVMSRAVGPELGRRLHPESAATSRRARANGVFATRDPCIECLTVPARRLLSRNITFPRWRGQWGDHAGGVCCRKVAMGFLPRWALRVRQAVGYAEARMFTGIITDVGTVEHIENRGDLRVRIRTAYGPEGIALGASIACDGVCLTVVDRGAEGNGAWFDVDVSAETLARTNLREGRRAWVPGRRINLERALRLGDELGGHIVSGHVDGLAEIIGIVAEGDSKRVTFRVSERLARFVAPKGSVALNGTSLTVNEVEGATFGVNIIPHTLSHTTFGESEVGDMVNVEIDTLARYVARLAEYAAA